VPVHSLLSRFLFLCHSLGREASRPPVEYGGVLRAVTSGQSLADIESAFARDLREFQKRREKLLLYE
jgi:hypothetical protein